MGCHISAAEAQQLIIYASDRKRGGWRGGRTVGGEGNGGRVAGTEGGRSVREDDRKGRRHGSRDADT